MVCEPCQLVTHSTCDYIVEHFKDNNWERFDEKRTASFPSCVSETVKTFCSLIINAFCNSYVSKYLGKTQTKTVVPALSEIQNIPYCLLAQCGEPITELVRMFQEGFALYWNVVLRSLWTKSALLWAPGKVNKKHLLLSTSFRKCRFGLFNYTRGKKCFIYLFVASSVYPWMEIWFLESKICYPSS